MKINFSKICFELVDGLPGRGKEVLERRFGLLGSEKETLDAIGKSHNITRERVRQIQEDAIKIAKDRAKAREDVFDHFLHKFYSYGNLKKEDSLLLDLGEEKFANHVFFLMSLKDSFSRLAEDEEHHSFWTIAPKNLAFPKKVIKSFSAFLAKHKKPARLDSVMPREWFADFAKEEKLNTLTINAFHSFLEISKKIERNQDGFFGFYHWPEINPKGLKDKAFIALKKENKPLHFRDISKFIGQNANEQSVHNELIKDSRFVLVGRGIYALKEWGYKEGVVQDVMLQILKEAKKPLTKEEIVDSILKQRQVKDKTVLLNLANKKYFKKTPEGKYTLVKSA